MSTKDFLEKDYYKALGVSSPRAADEIKQAYRKLARKYHPDANKGDRSAEERFKEISEAYKHPVGREEAQGVRRGALAVRRRLQGPRRGRPGRPRSTAGTAGGGLGGFDLGDLFGGGGEERGAGGSATCSAAVFGGRGTQTRPRRGTDVETEATLSFGNAIDGVTLPLRLTGDGPCPVVPRHRRPGGHDAEGLPHVPRAAGKPPGPWATSPCRRRAVRVGAEA